MPPEKKFIFTVIPKSHFPQNDVFGNVVPYQDDFLPKTKMVRVVHMNIFYMMDLQICDSTSEFLTETDKLGFWKIETISLGSNINF